ncbi:hypothetical protein NL676_025695 [Syzygium grande]|nr:hypothetical protein NL676_025695 [Syzygium grande]
MSSIGFRGTIGYAPPEYVMRCEVSREVSFAQTEVNRLTRNGWPLLRSQMIQGQELNSVPKAMFNQVGTILLLCVKILFSFNTNPNLNTSPNFTGANGPARADPVASSLRCLPTWHNDIRLKLIRRRTNCNVAPKHGNGG